MSDTKQRHWRSSEAGQYIHGDSMFTLRNAIHRTIEQVEAMDKYRIEIEKEMNEHMEEIKRHGEEVKKLMNEMKRQQGKLNNNMDRLKTWIEPRE